MKFQKRSGSTNAGEEQQKEQRVDPREQLTNECYEELLALAKEISQLLAFIL